MHRPSLKSIALPVPEIIAIVVDFCSVFSVLNASSVVQNSFLKCDVQIFEQIKMDGWMDRWMEC